MNQNDKLTKEVLQGHKYYEVWKELVQPFFDAKSAELFDAFVSHPTSDKEGLVLIKLQCNVLNQLQDEFMAHIQTGKLAQTQINEGE